MSFWDEMKEKASWAAEQVGETLSEVGERTGTEFNVLKVKRQISALEGEVEELYRKLGRRAYELAKDGGIDDAELSGLADEVSQKKEAIQGHEAEIEKMREESEAELKRRAEERDEREETERKAEAEKEETVGEAVWEDDEGARDDGTPPPP